MKKILLALSLLTVSLTSFADVSCYRVCNYKVKIAKPVCTSCGDLKYKRTEDYKFSMRKKTASSREVLEFKTTQFCEAIEFKRDNRFLDEGEKYAYPFKNEKLVKYFEKSLSKFLDNNVGILESVMEIKLDNVKLYCE